VFASLCAAVAVPPLTLPFRSAAFTAAAAAAAAAAGPAPYLHRCLTFTCFPGTRLCAACSALRGVRKVGVFLLGETADVLLDPASVTLDAVLGAVEGAGFTAKLLSSTGGWVLAVWLAGRLAGRLVGSDAWWWVMICARTPVIAVQHLWRRQPCTSHSSPHRNPCCLPALPCSGLQPRLRL